MYYINGVLCTIFMEFYVLYLWSFMYKVNGVVCTLSILVFKSLKKYFIFLAGKNNNIDTA
jgi:hypothetical protein